MLNFGSFITSNAEENKVRADYELKKTRQAQEFSRHENREAHIFEEEGTEDCEPMGRGQRAKDAFRRAQS